MSIIQFILGYDFKRPEKIVLCDLIYVSNRYKLHAATVQFGKPKELDQRPDIDEDPNSYIDAKVSQNHDHRLVPSTTGFLYRRIPLASLRPVDGIVIIPPTLPFSTYDILAQINAYLNTQLTEEDLEDIVYDSLDNDITIKAKPTSRIWVGERVLVVEGSRNKLLYPSFYLFGFVHPNHIEADKKAQVTTIANRENRVAWRELFDFDYGVMQAYVGPGGQNTRVFIHAHREGYVDQWLYYTRLSPDTINSQFETSEIPKINIFNTTFTTYQLLDQINTALNLHLTVDDVHNDAFLPGESEYPIRFKSSSMGWLAGIYMLQVAYVASVNAVRLASLDVPRKPDNINVRTYLDEGK